MTIPPLPSSIPSLTLPPPTVWVKRGICSVDSLLNILLLVLGYIPGLLHAWYIIARFPEEYEPLASDDYENGRVTYYYVSRDPIAPGEQPGPAAAGAPDGGRAHRELQRGPSYGAINTQAQNSAPPPAGSDGAQSTAPQRQQAGAEGSAKPPPTYAEAIQGDNKVQRS